MFSLHDLADVIVLRRSNLTRLVDRLEAVGFVCRKSCPSDQRGAFAEITEAGLAMQKQMWLVYAPSIAQYFAIHLSNTEVDVLSQVLKRLLAAGYKDERTV